MDLPITDQPSGFTVPNKNPDNLAGLEVLGQMSELMIKQRHPGCLECKILTFVFWRVEFWRFDFSVMECWEYQNKYDVFDQQGGNIFFLKEESGCLDRCCCANARALEVSFQDLQGNELLRFDRPLRCMEMPCDCCYPNWTQVRNLCNASLRLLYLCFHETATWNLSSRSTFGQNSRSATMLCKKAFRSLWSTRQKDLWHIRTLLSNLMWGRCELSDWEFWRNFCWRNFEEMERIVCRKLHWHRHFQNWLSSRSRCDYKSNIDGSNNACGLHVFWEEKWQQQWITPNGSNTNTEMILKKISDFVYGVYVTEINICFALPCMSYLIKIRSFRTQN